MLKTWTELKPHPERDENRRELRRAKRLCYCFRRLILSPARRQNTVARVIVLNAKRNIRSPKLDTETSIKNQGQGGTIPPFPCATTIYPEISRNTISRGFEYKGTLY